MEQVLLNDTNELEIKLFKKLITLLNKSLTYIKSNKNVEEIKNCTYEILDRVSRKRNSDETVTLINDIDNLMKKFEVFIVKSYFDENSELVASFKSDIDDLISKMESSINLSTKEEQNNGSGEEVGRLLGYIDNKIELLEKEYKNDISNEEYNFFSNKPNFEPTTENDINNLFSPSSNNIKSIGNEKLTREEVDGFIRKIDDKLAELEKEEKALDITRFDLPTNNNTQD